MIVYESRDYRIEYLEYINPRTPYVLDWKEKRGDHICLGNLGWFETEHRAHEFKNRHAERKVTDGIALHAYDSAGQAHAGGGVQ